MYVLLTVISLLVLLLTRIYSIIREQNERVRKIGDKLMANKFKLSKIQINFGSRLYQKFKAGNRFEFVPNLYSNSPENGIDYCVNYLDTENAEQVLVENAKNGSIGESTKVAKRLDEDSKQVATGNSNQVKNDLVNNSSKPIIVLLHGSPGSIYDFEEFVEQFGHKYRIIIPQLPDFELSRKSEQFWHSSEERAEFVLSFLRALDIKEIDCLVCHSGGNQIALHIISEQNENQLVVKSLVMITAPGMKWISGFQIKTSRKLIQVGRSYWKRNLFLILWPSWLSIACGVPKTLVENTSKDDLFWMTFITGLSEFELTMKPRYEYLAQRQIPTLYVMAERDGLFPKWKYFTTLDAIGCNREELFTNIGSDGNYESKSRSDFWFRILNFRFGGHFCFKKYEHVFHKEFIEFFERLQLQQGLEHEEKLETSKATISIS